MLGLAMRAGRVVIGTEQVLVALRKRGHIQLVLVSEGASDAAKERIRRKCEFYGVAMKLIDMETGEVGRLLGKTYAPVCVAVSDGGFAKEIAKAIDDPNL